MGVKGGREIILTTNFHPNERVAAHVAGRVAGRLREIGYRVEVVDIEAMRKSKYLSWAEEMDLNLGRRFDHRQEVIEGHPGALVVDFHDSDIEDVEEINHRYGCTIKLPDIEKDNGCWVVEVGAKYVPQCDQSISGLGKNHGLINAKYFTHESDVEKTKEAGLIGERDERKITRGIERLARKR